MSDTDNSHVKRFLSGRIFKIPYYQRGFVWTESNVKDLLDDIMYSKNSNKTHYIGNFVIRNKDGKDSFFIIDGQQRLTTLVILSSYIYWKLNEYENDITDGYFIKDETINRLNEEQKEWKKFFLNDYAEVPSEGNLKLIPANSQLDTYQELTVTHPNNRSYDTNDLSERRLVKTYETIKSWYLDDIETELTEKELSNTELSNQLDVIKELRKTIMKDMEVTEYKVENEIEAGRIFGVINDRGKSLNIADKVKSQLSYQVASLDTTDNQSVKDVHDVFATVFENVTEGGNTESEINNFMEAHWDLFSREASSISSEEITNLHRYIGNTKAHLGDSRDEEGMKSWINAYLNSLEECAKAYDEITNYNDYETEIEKDIKTIQCYLNEIADGNFLSIQLACEISLNNRNKHSILDLVESFSVLIHNICKRPYNTLTDAYANYASDIYWISKEEDIHSNVFGTNKRHPSSKGMSSSDDVVKWITGNIEDDIQEYVKNEDIEMYLKSEDVLKGNYQRGWTGIRNSEKTICYMFYRYYSKEYDLDVKVSRLLKNGGENITLEHITSQELDDSSINDMDTFSKTVDSLGNLTILESNLNSQANNKKPKNKDDSEYNESDFPINKELNDTVSNISPWDENKINERKEVLSSEFLDFFKH